MDTIGRRHHAELLAGRALKPATTYSVHLGGGMMDPDGGMVDLGMHGLAMGGDWATQSMMTGGMGGRGSAGETSPSPMKAS